MLLAFALAAYGLFTYGDFGPPQAPLHGDIDRITIDKSDRMMTLWQDGQAVRVYKVALGFAPEGAKSVQGDGKTPEGLFRVDRRNPQSAFTLSLGLDYPHPEHVAAARALGRSPGGDIFIHGQPNKVPDGFRLPGDWTAGCIALTNTRMQEIWGATPIGTPVEIRP